MDLNELNKHIFEVIHVENNRGKVEFEGYSSYEMHQMLHFAFGNASVVQMNKLNDEAYTNIPIFNQIKFFLGIVANAGEMKLTKNGFLPVKVVAELYAQGFMKEAHIESGIVKLYKETDSLTVNVTRIIAEMSGLVKRQKNVLRITKSGEKLINNNYELFNLIFSTYTIKFNWSHNDGYGNNQIGQLGFCFTLLLLAKYGKEERPEQFYTEKYFKAFPQLLDIVNPTYSTLEKYAGNCYSLRTFEHFLLFFGLINWRTEGNRWESSGHLLTTPLFNKMFSYYPHKVYPINPNLN